MIARSPSLTDQVKTHLKDRIVRGEFPDGRIPAETELAVRSRREPDDGPRCAQPSRARGRRSAQAGRRNVRQRRRASRSRPDSRRSGRTRMYSATTATRRRSTCCGSSGKSAGAETAAALGIGADDQVVVIEKLFREDEEPVVLTVNSIPAAAVRTSKRSDAKEPIYEFLVEHCGKHLTYYLSDIVPVVLDGDRAATLGVAPGTAAHRPSRRSDSTRTTTPVVKATSFFRDDLLRFRLIRRKAL